MTDELRAAIGLVISNVIAFVVAIEVVALDQSEAGLLMAVVNSTLIVIGYLFPKGQRSG